MFEYIEKCKKFEKLSTFERFALLANKSLIITNKLSELGLNVNNSLSLIATFILGSIVSDGEVNEKEFLFHLDESCSLLFLGDDLYFPDYRIYHPSYEPVKYMEFISTPNHRSAFHYPAGSCCTGSRNVYQRVHFPLCAESRFRAFESYAESGRR